MGYDIFESRWPARISAHNSERDREDFEAFVRFEEEVSMLIDADPEYQRIFGVMIVRD